MKIGTKFIGLTIIISMLVIAVLFAASMIYQAMAAASSHIIADGNGTLGCPDGKNLPASIRFSANDNGKSVSGIFKIELSDGAATGTGFV